MRDSSSHVKSSTSKFFHLMRYLVIIWLHSCLVLVSMICSCFNLIFPSSSSSNKIVWIGILSLLPFLSKKHGKLGVPLMVKGTSICNPYCQSSATLYKDYNAWVLIYCLYLVAWGKFVCKAITLEIPDPLLQISFHYDVDMLVVSFFFDIARLSFSLENFFLVI